MFAVCSCTFWANRPSLHVDFYGGIGVHNKSWRQLSWKQKIFISLHITCNCAFRVNRPCRCRFLMTEHLIHHMIYIPDTLDNSRCMFLPFFRGRGKGECSQLIWGIEDVPRKWVALVIFLFNCHFFATYLETNRQLFRQNKRRSKMSAIHFWLHHILHVIYIPDTLENSSKSWADM